ncbi:hypothetical protein GF369_03645 [Candidatus Peregrinibacteria bacterium]|nr:hypothetical protein [Candidatus Peregrinibacteria bacterium]
MFQDDQSQQNQPQQPQTPQQSQPAEQQQPATNPQPQDQQQNKQAAQQKVEQKQQPQQKPSTPAQKPEKTTQEERMWAAIGYIAFLGIVTLAIKPKSEFCKRHAAQGLIIFAVWFVSLILFAMPSIIGVIGGLLLLGATVLAVLGIIKSIQSYTLELPVLSAVAKKVPTDSIIGSVTGKKPEAKPAQPKDAQQKQQPQQPAEETKQQTPPPTPQQNQDTTNNSSNSGQNQKPPQA